MIEKPSLNDFPRWAGNISRIEAEKKLDRQPPGAFILRNGDILDSRITQALAKENHEKLESCIVTFVEPHEKISERLILHTPKGWTLYEDDPDLHDPFYHFYPTVKALLQSMHLSN